MPAGRKPLPTHLKILKGNPGKHPLNKREPQFAQEIPDCPPHLDAVAREEWERITEHLFALNLVTVVDRAALAAYCQCYSRWVDAETKLRATGMIVKTANDYPMVNPYFTVIKQTLKQMQAFLTEFGLTPASRSRISVPKRETSNRFSKLKA